ncbi:MAG: hypothetical protein AAFR83_24185 [Cyanobacteria bacterium J06629_18]
MMTPDKQLTFHHHYYFDFDFDFDFYIDFDFDLYNKYISFTHPCPVDAALPSWGGLGTFSSFLILAG